MSRHPDKQRIAAALAALAATLAATTGLATASVLSASTSSAETTTSSTATTSAATGAPTETATSTSTAVLPPTPTVSTTSTTTTAGTSEAPSPATSTTATSTSTSTTQASSTRTTRTRTHTAHRTGGGHAHNGGTAAPKRGHRAPAPAQAGGSVGGGLIPPLPSALRAAISGVPAVFIEAYDVPPFLLPLYQAAGTAYGVPWQVLAAINEVETDYGRDLSLSSAGAEGWMQFMPASWSVYGVDAAGSGYRDPYNPADAIFAAARYLAAAGGSAHIRAAVYAYNHSQTYVESVMLRAQLLGKMPPELLGALTNLAEARFPVHAPAHFADGFAPGAHGPLVGTTIYSQPGAPAIAVKDGTITAIGESPALGHYIRLTDADGNTYTYAGLGSIATVRPVLSPRHGAPVLRPAGRAPAPAPTVAATGGAQRHSPLSAGAISSGFTFGATPSLQSPPRPAASGTATQPAGSRPASFLEGRERVSLQPLTVGSQVIAGTVLGHLSEEASEAHMLFQIRPAGALSPQIDPKPILDAWVALEATGIFGASGESPFLAASPTAAQVPLESKGTLSQQVLRNTAIQLPACGRTEVQAGRVDRRVLAALELLSVSGLQPTVSRMRCAGGSQEQPPGGLSGYGSGEAVDIAAINGVPIAGHSGPGGVADLAERELMRMQGTMQPRQIAGPIEYPGAEDTVRLPASRTLIHLSFAAPHGAAHIADLASQMTGGDWLALTARLGQISDPRVAMQPSAAALADRAGEAEEEQQPQAGATAGGR